MADISEESLQELDIAVAEVRDFMRNRGGIRGGNNRMSFHINAGGVGVWICVTCFVSVLACCLVGSFWMSSELSSIHQDLKDRKDENDAMKSYLSAIYMLAPQLKPKEDKDHGTRSDHHSDAASSP